MYHFFVFLKTLKYSTFVPISVVAVNGLKIKMLLNSWKFSKLLMMTLSLPDGQTSRQKKCLHLICYYWRHNMKTINCEQSKDILEHGSLVCEFSHIFC